jgi:hypothetical protein
MTTQPLESPSVIKISLLTVPARIPNKMKSTFRISKLTPSKFRETIYQYLINLQYEMHPLLTHLITKKRKNWLVKKTKQV